jgi:predicted DNA-binding helix-hairpin-helix protein
VDNLALVEIDERVDDLQLIILHFHFSQPLAPLDQLVQSLVGADLQQDIDVLVVLEDVFELYDILMT